MFADANSPNLFFCLIYSLFSLSISWLEKIDWLATKDVSWSLKMLAGRHGAQFQKFWGQVISWQFRLSPLTRNNSWDRWKHDKMSQSHGNHKFPITHSYEEQHNRSLKGHSATRATSKLQKLARIFGIGWHRRDSW